MAEVLPRDKLPVCHALHQLIERLNARHRSREFAPARVTVPVHKNRVKPRVSRTVHIVHQGIANHEYLVGGLRP